MKLLKFLPHALIIGVLAAFAQWVNDQSIFMEYLGTDSKTGAANFPLLPSWIVFQTWAIYFIAGCEVKKGIKSSACFILGLLVSWAIVLLGTGTFKGAGSYAIPLAVGVVATAVIYMEHIKVIDMIPVYFLASGGSFFALLNMGKTPQQAMIISCASLVFGQLLGFATVKLRGGYQAMLDKNNPASLEEKKAA